MHMSRTLTLVPAATLLGLTLAAAQALPPRVAPGEPDPNKGVQKTDKAKGTDKKPGEPSGIAECDKYFSMAEACVASKKMSKEDQQTTEANVARLRLMLPIARSAQGRETLVERCSKSLELAQTNDKYGCYKTKDKAPRK